MKRQLKRVAQVFTGTTPPTSEQKYYDSEDIDWYSPGDIGTDNIYLTESSKKISNLYLVEKNTKPFPRETVLMVGIGATVGKVAYSDRACYSNQQINAIVFNQKLVLPKFGAYQLLNMSKEINQKTPVVTLQIFNQNKVKQIELDIPTLAEQRRIVDYLDTKLSEIDRQVSLLTRKRDAYLRLKKSIINHAVTKGLDKNAKMKDSGIEWIGQVPEQWEVKRGKDTINVLYGFPADSNKFADGEGIPLIRIRDIDSNQTETTYTGDYPAMYEIHKGDLLVGMDGDFNVAKWKGNTALLNQRVCKLTAKRCLFQEFLYYVIVEPLEEINGKKVLTTVKHLSAFDLGQLSVPLPPLPEQRSIAAYLDDKCSKIDTIVANLNKQISRYGDLKRSLIDEVITGKRAV